MPPPAEDRIRGIVHCDVWRHQGGFRFSLNVGREVRDVPGVRPLRVRQSVVFVVGIEMISSRLEIRPLAPGGLVNVYSVLARSQVMEIRVLR